LCYPAKIDPLNVSRTYFGTVSDRNELETGLSAHLQSPMSGCKPVLFPAESIAIFCNVILPEVIYEGPLVFFIFLGYLNYAHVCIVEPLHPGERHVAGRFP
jgi:hypothetical protein